MARAAAFSLLELVMVIVILGVVAALAVPRLSLAGRNASIAAMTADRAVLQSAIDRFHAEHNGMFPSETAIADQLLAFTDLDGNVSSSRDHAHRFGPYVRRIPALAHGPNARARTIAAEPGPGVGWIYDPVGGLIYPNLFENGKIDPSLEPLMGLSPSQRQRFEQEGTLP
jgi:general secretion pathway protein G